MAAPFFRTGIGNVTSVSGSTGTAVLGTRPQRARNGDILVWAVGHRGPGALSGIPAGWTELAVKATATYTLSLLWHLVTDITAEPYEYNITAPVSGRWITSMARLAGADTGFANEQGTVVTSGGGTSLVFPAVTTTQADELVIGVGWAGFVNAIPPLFTALPAGTTSVLTPTAELPIGTSTQSSMIFFSVAQPVAGSSGTKTATIQSAIPSSNGVGFLTAVRSSGVTPSAEPAFPPSLVAVTPMQLAVGSPTTTSTHIVPVNTRSTDTVLLLVASGTTDLADLTLTIPAGAAWGAFTDEINAANVSWRLYKITGVVGGQSITVNWSSTVNARNSQLFVFDKSPGVPGLVGSRSTLTGDVTAPPIAVAAGAAVWVLGVERTAVDATTVVSTAVGSGETLSKIYFQQQDADPDITTYLGRFVATFKGTVGPVTLTYDTTSTNASALLFPELSGTEVESAATPSFGNQSGQFSVGVAVPGQAAQFKSASPVVTSADSVSITVPAGTQASDVVYVWTVWGNSSVKTVTISQPAAKLGGVSTVIPSRHDGNVGWNIQAFTGLVTGDVIQVDTDPGNNSVKLIVFDQRLSPPGSVGNRPSSSTLTVVPGTALVPPSPVFIFAVERTLAAGTLVTNAVNDQGFPVTQKAFDETVGDPNATFYLGQLDPSTGNSGATTLTYTTAVGNAGGVSIPAVGAPAACAPVFGSQKGYFSIGVKSLVDGLLRTNLGRPSFDTIRVKTRTQGPGNVRLAVSTAANMASPVYSSATTPDADGYAALQVGGLLADTPYWYQIEFAGVLTGSINATRTWPTPGIPAATVAIMAAACTSGFGSMNGPSNPTTFTNMRNRRDAKGNAARLWVDLGDDFYPHVSTSPQGWPFPESEQVARSYWEAQHGQSQRTAFHKVIPTSHTYSDNDFLGSNSDSSIAPATVLVVNRVRRQVLSDGPFGSTDGKGLYWSALLGRTLIIQTDGRTYSSNNLLPLADTTKSMLGTVQKQWLLDQFARKDYSAVLWCHDNQWIGSPALSTKRPALDNWQVYPIERQAIADYIVANAVPLLAYVHADNHMLMYDDGTNNSYGHFPYTMTGPVSQSAQTWPNPTTGGIWPTAANGQNPANFYTWIEITDDGVNITARFQGIDATSGADLVKIDNTSTIAAQRPSTWLKHEFYANVELADIIPQPSIEGGIVGPAGPQGVPGPPGPAGTSGTKWWNGVGPPSPVPVGSSPGDYYLNTTNGDVYVL